MSSPSYEPARLETPRHERYWLRCLRSLLPTAYTSNDSILSTLSFFIVASLDLLAGKDGAASLMRPNEKAATRKWVLSLQRPEGGFVGTDNLVLCSDDGREQQGDGHLPDTRTNWPGRETGNIAGTYFALLLLALTWEREQDVEVAKAADKELAEISEKEAERRIEVYRDMARLVQARAGLVQGADAADAVPHMAEYLDEVPQELIRRVVVKINTLMAAAGSELVTEKDFGFGEAEAQTDRVEGEHPSADASSKTQQYIDAVTSWRALDKAAPPTGAFAGVDGPSILAWLRKLQRPDGSFGECLVDGEPYGAWDMRICYMAAGVRWILRRPGASEPDIDVDALRKFILSAQTYDGGVAERSEHESHAGYAFCGVAALELLERQFDGTPASRNQLIARLGDHERASLARIERWLFMRAARPQDVDLSDEEHPLRDGPPEQIGFTGRVNKGLDSCYTWWVCGALDILDVVDMFPRERVLDFLLRQMQHPLGGGFGKTIQSRPDVFHSFLGLASCAMLANTDGSNTSSVYAAGVELKSIDSSLVVSRDAVRVVLQHRGSAYSRR